jgi:eukaryotic-like serine/threonine-protein kinase
MDEAQPGGGVKAKQPAASVGGANDFSGRRDELPRSAAPPAAHEPSAAAEGLPSRDGPSWPLPAFEDPAPEGGRRADAPGMIVAGKFALVRMIAEGTTTQVFEAEDSLVGRRVALKVLLPDAAQHADVVRRFRQEANATAMASHPNVVTIHEVGRRSDGALYIVQELLSGETLQALRERHGRLSAAEAASVLEPIARALEFAHSLGIVHRDVKPSNILVAALPHGAVVPKLIDFGVARMETPRGRGRTMAGTLLGTAHYMSPEQALAAPFIDGRADVWALGVVLFELVSGKRPFDGPNEHAVLAGVLSDAPQRLEVVAPGTDRRLVDVVHHCLSRDVRERPTMDRLVMELQRLAEPRLLAGLLAVAPASQRTEPTEGDDLLPGDLAAVDLATADLAEEGASGNRPSAAVEVELSEELPVSVDEEVDQDPEPLEDEDIEVLHAGAEEPKSSASPGDWPRSTAQIQVDASYLSTGGSRRDRFADAAQRALRVNALEKSIVHAEMSISAGNDRGEALGQMRLVQSIALYWLGAYAESLAHADASCSALEQGSSGWLGALGYKVMALGKLGMSAELAEARRALVTDAAELGAAHVIALCRLAVTMTLEGDLLEARQLVRSLRDRMDRAAASESVVFAWLDRAFAERAAFVGDPARELARRASALERFTSAGDVRNACQERSELGAVWLHMGVFDEAERALRESLQMAEPMKLHVVGVSHAYLGALALRRRDVETAERSLTEALSWGVERGDRRVEAMARVHLATVLEQTRGHSPALEQLAAAREVAEGLPAQRAHAEGAEAAILLRVGEKDAAAERAELAVQILDEHGGAGEAEALIRLTHALSLRAVGALEDARLRIRDARSRLVGLAERISTPRHRRAFLELPENRRILGLAREWVDGQRTSTHDSVG